MKYLVLLLVTLFSISSWACSFPRTYEIFNPAPLRGSSTIEVPKPEIIIGEISRGRDGAGSMCADAGTIEVEIVNHRRLTGYKFVVVDGEDSESIFPKEIITPTSGRKSVRFVWLDGASDIQEPINLKLSVIAINSFGVESEPTEILVTHSGKSH
ncbi:hypothetical protein OQJ62_10695 [Microbulbifer thermotolerans]|uniref:hypothetical protein n=1 Tax=Microbulbifer thermotolerans TaxID=252514 RepID=UPI002248DBED|nr:hypothetical protein [Microbulbifer thermotolerans]MCX2795388.1 hypothetical protein [Microbulbifer thermotolerans]